MATVGVAETPSAGLRPAGRLALLKEVVHRPSGLFGLVVVSILLIVAAFPSFFAPYAVDEQDIPSRLQGPSWDHLLGTDEIGRDLLSRVIFSTRIELGVAVPSVLGALIIGLVLGVIAGYRGGMLDNALIVVMDSLQAFPAVILALVLLALLGSSLQNVIIVITVAFIPNYARVSRALVLALKNNQFVEAERSLGASPLAARRLPHRPEHPRAALHPARDGHPERDRGRGRPLVPRPRRPAAHGLVGRDARGRFRPRRGLAVGRDRAGPRADDHHARVHAARRDAA